MMHGASSKKNDEYKLSTHFKLGEQKFDKEVTEWHKTISKNVGLTSANLGDPSDLVLACSELLAEGLNETLKGNNAIRARAQNHYKVIEGNEEVMTALFDALTAKQSKEDPKERAKKWSLFRKTAAQNLSLQEQAIIPEIQYPTPGSADAIKQWITKNKQLKLSAEQTVQYKALQIVLYSFRQVHRNCDKETDNPNLLLHKKVTETQEK